VPVTAGGGEPVRCCRTDARAGEALLLLAFRPQVLRAYDERGWIHPATRVHDGTEPERELAEVLATPGVVEVHSRNVAYGCWMFTAVPAD
jgi:hypothetical protein